MKKCWILLLLSLVLTGCGRKETFETVADEPVSPVMAEPAQVFVQLPEETVTPVLKTDAQQVYLCESYEIVLENRSSGDLQETIRAVSGFDWEALTVIQTQQGEAKRYEFVWTCAGEERERLGRAVILDDGQYHYCLSVVRDQEPTQIVWDQVFSSFCLV